MNSGLERGAAVLAAALLLASPVLVPAPGEATDSSGPGSTIRVATWNLNWFGHPKHPRTTEALASLAGNIASSGVHVLALQEVAVTRLGPKGEPRSYAMDELEAILADEHGQQWEYWIHKGAGEQHLGFMWRPDSVELVASPLHGLENKSVENVLKNKKGKTTTVKKPPWVRIPVISHVRAGDGLTDFTLINVHLKAAELQFGKESFREMRRAACASLAKWIDQVWSNDASDVPSPTGKKAGAVKGTAVAKVPPLVATLFTSPFPQSPGGAQSVKAMTAQVLSGVDHDLAVLGDFNVHAEPEVEAEPLLGLGMHFLGGGEPTHAGGATLDRVLVSLPMGEEHALSRDLVPKGEAFTVSGVAGKGGSDHKMVSFTVSVRPDDD